jgi:hypothetical protein
MTKQAPSSVKPDPPTNHFLARLESEDYAALMKEAKIVPLKFRKRMLTQDERISAVYFPITCMFSLLVTNDGQQQMEMATIGKEGMVGASEALQMQGAIGLNLVQLPAPPGGSKPMLSAR